MARVPPAASWDETAAWHLRAGSSVVADDAATAASTRHRSERRATFDRRRSRSTAGGLSASAAAADLGQDGRLLPSPAEIAEANVQTGERRNCRTTAPDAERLT